jgi:alpha-D-xyloside xylohydrolase
LNSSKLRTFAIAVLLVGLPQLTLALPSGLDAAGQLNIVAPDSDNFSYARLQNGVQLRSKRLIKNIVFYGPRTLRINTTLGPSLTAHPSLAVTAQPATVKFEIRETPDQLTLLSKHLRVVADKRTASLTFLQADGKLITQERADSSQLKQISISNAQTYEVKQTFTLSTDEALYGLGQYDQPYMDYRGQRVLMVQTNIGIVVPVLISTRRYGLLWDSYSKSTFEDGSEGASFWSESSPAGIDYYLMTANDMDGVIAAYRDLTGAAPLPPKAALGLFMSKERYQTQQRLIEVTRLFRENQFPLDYIVQDWQYWGGDKDGTWSGMIWDKDRYPDPRSLTATLHGQLHVKLMNSIWPSIGNDTALAKELDAKGLRFAPLHWISQKARVYDAFSAEGRAIYFKHIKQGLLDVGVDALWMDGTEVEVGGACHDPTEVEADIKGLGSNALGDFTRYLNPYSLMTTKGTYEGQRATSNKRVFTLTRSAWAGQQRYAAVPWSGDTTASWTTFRNQIAGGLNVSMAGLPYWTQDTGGFFVNFEGGERNPEYRELFARWHQFAIFNPIYRIHGTSIEREPYIFKTLDPPMYQSLLSAAQLRYRLLPYIYSLAWKTTAQGYTMMRGLSMDFPDDLRVRKLQDELMFGPAFLVHPVTRAMFHIGDPPAATIPPEALRTPDGKPGVAVEYFEGTNLERSVSTLVDSKIDYTWPGPPLANPPPGLKSLNDFSGRWQGFVLIPEDGEYEFGVEADDGFRLWLNDQIVVQDWSNGPLRYKRARINLKKGQRLPMRLEYFQGRLARGLRLAWRTPQDRREIARTAAKADNIMETYLPAGAQWYDFWTHQLLSGGQTVRSEVSLQTLPLFVRAGSIVPMGPVVQYATDQRDAPYEIRIYSGANARFTVYEDDNETYDYERGQRATYELSWNDASRTLKIGARQGSFPSMVRSRMLRVVLIDGNQETRPAKERTVSYAGKPLEIDYPAG